MIRIFILFIVSFLFLLNPQIALGDDLCQDCPKWHGRSPYGDYCKGHRWGWYGSKRRVKDIKEAEKIIKEFFSSYKDIKIMIVRERRHFFEAEIRDNRNNLIDIVIVDKRTGRIRSIY